MIQFFLDDCSKLRMNKSQQTISCGTKTFMNNGVKIIGIGYYRGYYL